MIRIYSVEVSTEELDYQERFDLMMMKDVAHRYTGTLTQGKDTLIDRITVQLSPKLHRILL